MSPKKSWRDWNLPRVKVKLCKTHKCILKRPERALYSYEVSELLQDSGVRLKWIFEEISVIERNKLCFCLQIEQHVVFVSSWKTAVYSAHERQQMLWNSQIGKLQNVISSWRCFQFGTDSDSRVFWIREIVLPNMQYSFTRAEMNYATYVLFTEHEVLIYILKTKSLLYFS